uniref:intercellular adhesion molecule 1-like isoform X2 n=1 Tax=Semicossyphus pulcher TaxID=241346 RepID=UPI0037E7A8E0
MSASGWPITPLLFCLFSSATSSPVSISTSAPPLLSQISPPSPLPAILPSLLSPSLSVPPPIPPLTSNSAELTESVSCSLTMSPSALVVRFGDPVTANCSVRKLGFSLLGWIVSKEAPPPTQEHYLVWSVDRMTEWSIEPMCFAVAEMEGQCDIKLPLIVFKPPDNVSISFVNHTGPMFESHPYTLECTVKDVAPVENLIVTFHKGHTVLGQLQPNNNTEKAPVTEIFTLHLTPNKDDDGAEFWCEAKLELGPEGPPHPPVMVHRSLVLQS